jgi:hypothetical protein
VYTGSLWPPAFSDEPDGLVQQIRAQAADARTLPAMAWWGELGVDNGKQHAAVWTDTALDVLDDLDAGWAWWQWRQDWGWGVRNDAGDFLNTDFFRHLARPFLTAGPAGVQAGRGDGLRGYLRLSVVADHADAPAMVAWPTPTLGRPVVSGSCVENWTWDSGRGEVTLSFVSGGACTVELTPA